MERIPILRLGDVLLVSIQVDLTDWMAQTLQDDLTERIVSTRSHGVLIDISALEALDSFMARTLATIASMAHVLDADAIIVGMRPSVAITLVELGVELTGVRTAVDAERGFTLLNAGLTASPSQGDDRAGTSSAA